MGFRYIFDEKKATQAAGILISKSGGTINYMKLIKLIYLANRESFRHGSANCSRWLLFFASWTNPFQSIGPPK